VRKIIRIFQKKEFAVFIFGVYFILLNWPFLSIVDRGDPRLIFYYLIALWIMNIGLLYLMSLGYRTNKEDKFRPKRPEH
jgi:apolipoprotein N-acyltransferase